LFSQGTPSGKLVDVSLESVSAELYSLAPSDFTAARNARASEARKAGDTALAGSLTELRKPTVGAWLVNLLARERAEDLGRLIALGGELRRGQNRSDGEVIRRVSKRKQEAVAGLVLEATSLAKSRGQPVSEAAATDLESTLDAAFADPTSAESVRAGCLATALRYSGLGLADTGSASSRRTSQGDGPSKPMAAAKRDLDLANREAKLADAEAEKALHAVALADNDLKRLKATATLAVRRASDAQKKAAAAKKRLRG
jgi:hypothetical protein